MHDHVKLFARITTPHDRYIRVTHQRNHTRGSTRAVAMIHGLHQKGPKSETVRRRFTAAGIIAYVIH